MLEHQIVYQAKKMRGKHEPTRMPSEPGHRITTFSNLTPEERRRIVVEWNQTEREYPRDKCVHELFEEQAERAPDAIAVVFEGASLTYGELNERANQLAHFLRKQGVGSDVLVGISVHRSMEMVVGLLAILKAGGAYVPMDPDYPAERLAFLLADTGVNLILTQRHLESRWLSASLQVLFLDDKCPTWGGEPDDNLSGERSPENLAYVMFTSGSTGVPKGVEVIHRGIVRLVRGADYVELDETQSVLQLATLSFDASTFEIWAPLLHGGRCVLAPHELPNPEELRKLLRREKVRTMWLTSTLFNTLVDENVNTLEGIEQLLVGGEALSVKHIRRAQQALGPRTQLINGYGPTECTTFACCHRLPMEIPQTCESIPIGRPISNTTAYVLDSMAEPVPVGVAGELYIGGDGLARGYLNRPDLTIEKFLCDPFSDQLDARMYRTGDLVRRRSDGALEFLGRRDRQIKLRGYRIELGEIEAALCAHNEVWAAVVVVCGDRVEEQRLAAYVVANPDCATRQNLRAFLKGRLPAYMIPATISFLDRLPMTSAGKVDHRALPPPDTSRPDIETDFVVPRTTLEESLARMWREILSLDCVGRTDNFFELGGHSLLAIRIASQITHLLGHDIPLRWVFEYPTIEEFANQVESLEGELSPSRPIEPIGRRQPPPVSFGQQGMWLVQQLLPDLATYNEPFAWRFFGKLNRERIQRVLRVMIERHEVLRTALAEIDGALVQVINGAQSVILPWREEGLREVTFSQREAALEECAQAEARRPFNLAQAPLWRVLLIDLADDEHAVVFTFHHGIIDEWSMRLFVGELNRLYAADGHVELAGLPELPVQYADYSAWQRQNLAGELRERQLAFWKDQLADLPSALQLPADRPRPRQPSGQGAVHEFRLVGPIVTKLKRLAKQETTTLFSVLLAGFQVWLYRYTGQTELVVGTPVAKRGRPEVQSLIGYFLNTLPIRARLEGRHSFRQSLRQLCETLLGSFSHSDLPFEQIVETVVKERQPGLQPVYQVMFVLLEENLPGLSLDQTQGMPLTVRSGTSKNDLTLDIMATNDEWLCRLEYSTDLFNGETVARMADHFTELLHSIVKNPDESIADLNLMCEEERRRILVEWNQTEREYPRDKCVDQLFEEQVERAPEAIAVVFEDKSLTYGELNARANQLARFLRRQGVGPDVPVGICVERSMEMIVGLLAILKAGGAYVPMDPGDPWERLSFLLADTATRVILTQRRLESRWQSANSRMFFLDDDRPAWSGEPDDNLRGDRSSEDLAYVIYTSGSTGVPKGVEVIHRGIVRLLCNANYVQLDETQSVLQLATLSFDASTFEIWGPLLHGGRCVLAPHQLPDPEELRQLLRREKVRTMWLTSTLFNTLVDENVNALEGIEQLLVGGEALSVKHIRRAQQALGSRTQLINGYGPTESTTFACCHRLPTIILETCQSIPIGRPISNTTAFVLDPVGQPVPIGVAGELYLGGDGLARGYLSRPDLTIERFPRDPFSDRPDARMYRTGDLVRWRSDGALEFLGRRDHQIKLRGYRIELGEIEAALCSHEQVAAAAVVVCGDRVEEHRLAAYVVADSAQTARPDLRNFLKDRLPKYMIPASITFLERLPVTSSGKVDHRALPAPEVGHVNIDGQISSCPSSLQDGQAQSELEEKIAEVWRELLRLPRIDRDDDFFDIGGHSLLAIRVVARLSGVLDRAVTVEMFFRCTTIAALTRELTKTDLRVAESVITKLRPGNEQTPLFLFPPIGAEVFAFREFLPELETKRAVYAVDWHAGHDPSVPRSLIDSARECVAHIQRIQPSGPYMIAGYSIGGKLAFETARLLVEAGHIVPFLGVIDADPGGIPKPSMQERASAVVRFFENLPRWFYHDLLSASSAELRKRFRKRVSQFYHRLINLGSFASESPRIAAIGELPDQDLDLFQRRWKADLVANAHYHSRQCPIKMTLFRARVRPLRDSHQSDLGWKHFALDGVEVHEIPGQHVSMMRKPNVHELARRFVEAMDADEIISP